MKRRQFNAIAISSAAGLAASPAAVFASGKPAPKKKPNILFIMTDQQHAGMMSCAGNKWLKTPAMDRLAASGVRFERAYATNPVCCPARFSLQTGLMPSAIGMGENKDSKNSTVTDKMTHESLAPLLRLAGYETVYGGKTHLPPKMNVTKDLGYQNLTSDAREELADACARFIKSPREKPFFLFASFINPHDICFMAINDLARKEGKAPMGSRDSKTCEGLLEQARRSGDIDAFIEKNCPPLPANYEIPEGEPECVTRRYTKECAFREHARRNWPDSTWRLHRWLYCRLTEMVDEKIGKLLDALREAGLEEETLIVFTSDHGDMDSAHRLEHKSVLYEESARIPFVMSQKGTIPEGRIDETHLISNGLDLLPTLCDYAGVEAPSGLEGKSARRVAEGKEVENWRDFLVVESQASRMVRTKRFKYCIYESGQRRETLVDLEKDPGEMQNLAGVDKYREVLDKHRRLLREWVERTGDRIAAEYVKVG